MNIASPGAFAAKYWPSTYAESIVSRGSISAVPDASAPHEREVRRLVRPVVLHDDHVQASDERPDR